MSSSNPKQKDEYEVVKDLRSHILIRPDMYVGSSNPVTWEGTHHLNDTGHMSQSDVSVVPALVRCFDELLCNSADNCQRDPMHTTILAVTIDSDTGRFTIRNNGSTPPVRKHMEVDDYVPTVIFGRLLTGSNFDDDTQRTTAGRNGYGAKLANIFSTEFTVRINDGTNVYEATWTDHMEHVRVMPVKKALKSSKPFTEVSMVPDYAYFKMTPTDMKTSGTMAVLLRRIHDVCACTPKTLKVSLDGTRLPVVSFEDYCNKLVANDSPIVVDTSTPGWDVAVYFVDTPPEGGQLSWVNNIWTRKDGTHVQHVQQKWFSLLSTLIQKASKRRRIKLPARLTIPLKAHLAFVVNATVVNPTFEGQCKEELTSTLKEITRSPYTIDDGNKTIKRLTAAGGIVDRVMEVLMEKETAQLSKTDGSKKSRVRVEKLADAAYAGTKNSNMATLFLTEGDSAKTLAVNARNDPKRQGVFPLRGKVANVMNASKSMLMNNKELSDIRTILGLKIGKEYTNDNIHELRYRHVVFMTDQDYDGFHIKGLLINLFHHLWPSLARVDQFLGYLQTPVIKAKKGKKEHSFFSMPEFDEWKAKQIRTHGEKGVSEWSVKYYKGLGTNTTGEAKVYFTDPKHLVWLTPDDETDMIIRRAFDKKRSNERKEWLSQYSARADDSAVTRALGTQSYTHFFTTEFIQHPMDNVARSIMSIDGLKDSQRKIIWTCLKRNIRSDFKVARLSAVVAQDTAYKHGEDNLNGTIVGLAQKYAGSNNLPLLVDSGQFGTRHDNGHDAASARYINTFLHDYTPFLFRDSDMAILPSRKEEGRPVEPHMLLPIVATVLINGQEGIGTGWSTSMPSFNPIDVLDNTLALVRSNGDRACLTDMIPWYRHFTGDVRMHANGRSYTTAGRAVWDGGRKVQITDLPIGTSINKFKAVLDTLVKKGTVHSYGEMHLDDHIQFDVVLVNGASPNDNGKQRVTTPTSGDDSSDMVTIVSAVGDKRKRGAEMDPLPDEWMATFRLVHTHSLNNMHLLDQEGRCRKHDNAKDIMMQHYAIRLEGYVQRKTYLLRTTDELAAKKEDQARFIELRLDGELETKMAVREDLINHMREAHHFTDPELLLKMGFESETKENVERLRADALRAREKHRRLENTTHNDMWLEDLRELREKVTAVFARDAKKHRVRANTKGKGKKSTKRREKRSRTQSEPTASPV